MQARLATLAALAFVLALGATARAADPWDLAPAGFDDDNAIDTLNALDHRSEQVHDVESLGVIADEDWYIVAADARTSHEVVIDDLQGEVLPFTLERRDSTGVSVIQSGNPMTWLDATASTYYVRMFGANCSPNCTSASRYRIRLLDTTFSIPRFNNSATQVTLLVIHNESTAAVDGALHFRNAAGASLGTAEPFLLQPNATAVFNTAALQSGAFLGTSGSVSVASTARYGRLTGKAVALEPATGFTFDTAMSPRP